MTLFKQKKTEPTLEELEKDERIIRIVVNEAGDEVFFESCGNINIAFVWTLEGSRAKHLHQHFPFSPSSNQLAQMMGYYTRKSEVLYCECGLRIVVPNYPCSYHREEFINLFAEFSSPEINKGTKVKF